MWHLGSLPLLFIGIYVLQAPLLAASMRAVTWNLRFDSQPNNIPVSQSLASLGDPLQQPAFLNGSNERPWSTRRLRVAEHLLSEGIVLAGFQEALVRQVNDLAELFGSEWSWIGVGRDDGVQAGEFSPIFYKRSAITLLSNDSFWTSNTPFEPSRFPGAGSFRICTVAHFTLATEDGPRNFTFLNTHMDDQSDAQRRLAASLLLTRARFEAVTTGGPVLISGDFNRSMNVLPRSSYVLTRKNSPSTGVDSGAYSIITGAALPVAINATFAQRFSVPDDQLPDFKMIDLRGQAPRRAVSTNFATFTGFTAPNDASQWSRIDFIFGGSNLEWIVDAYKVDSVLADDGALASDHRPVFADINI